MRSMEYTVLVILGLAVGVCITTQSGINATLRTALTTPLQAAFISFLVGTLLLGSIVLIQGGQWFNSKALAELPWWCWIGGMIGAFNIAVSIYLAPRLGALLLGVSVITGQMLTSLAFDQFGLLGFPKVEITTTRIVGACFMLFGLFLIGNK